MRAEKKGRKITQQTKPAIVLENRELPELPEFKMEDPLPSNFTGEDAIWYMFRLSQLSREQQAKRDKEEEREKLKNLKTVIRQRVLVVKKLIVLRRGLSYRWKELLPLM